MTSPFSHLLFTNYAPNSSESAEIIRFCSGSESELARLKAEISKLQQALDALSRQRDEIQDIVDAHRALLSPVRHLPVEILQQIFVLCLQTTSNPVMHESEAPLLLGRICRRWREISMSTAELWSSVHIVAYNGNILDCPDATRSNIDRTTAWLGRSGEVPLDVSLYCPPFLQPSIGSPFSEFLSKSILPYSRRWRSIALETSLLDLAFLDPCLDGVPLLETFSYCDNRGTPPQDEYGPLGRLYALLGTAQKLRRVSLHCSSHLPLQLPLHQLTELIIENYRASLDEVAWIQLLGACTRLEVCSLKYAPRLEHSLVSQHQITLPHLKVLCIHSLSTPTESSATLFECLTVPDLRQLESSSHLDGLVVPIIFGLLTRSSCSLTRLVLYENDIEADDICQCFHLTPALRDLVLKFPFTWNPNTGQYAASPQPGQILRSLTPSTSLSLSSSASALSIEREPDSKPHLCPDLRFVIFGRMQPNVLPDLLHFLRERVKPNSTVAPLPGLIYMDACVLDFILPLDDAHRAEIENLVLGDGDRTNITIDAPPQLPNTYSRWAGLDNDATHGH